MKLLPVSVAYAQFPIARKLTLHFDSDRLMADLASMPQEWWAAHLGPYHDGGWEAISLWAPGGDHRGQRSFGGAFAATEAMQRCRYIPEVLDIFPCIKSRVRLMRLRPDGHIFRHSDPLESIAPNLVRLHVPIMTNPGVKFLVDDTAVQMFPGEVWHVDVRFPHEVHNSGRSHRVHLVMDLVANDAIQQLLAAAEPLRSARLTRYFIHYYLERGSRHLRRWRG
jgi:hypothetical protein